MNRNLATRASLRYLVQHPWQPLLAALGAALGIAVVTAVNLASVSADRAFRLALETLTGTATHQVVGSPEGIDGAFYTRLRHERSWIPARPIVTGRLSANGETLRVLGIDPLAEGGWTRSATARPTLPVVRLLGEPRTAFLAATTAKRLGLDTDAELVVQAAAEEQRIRVIGLIPAADARERAALEGLLVTDIATAQELLGRNDRLDRIDLVLDTHRDPAIVEHLRHWLPAGLQLLHTRTRNEATAEMTRAFRVNLQAMALLSLVVGAFLIYNSVSFAVLQRRDLFATLRVLGMTRLQVFRLVITETALIGTLGSLFGTVLGVALARLLLDLVSRTINDLYFALQVRAVSLDHATLAAGLVAGVICAVAAGLPPAWEAARTRPRLAQNRSSLEIGAHRLVPWLAAAGLGMILAAYVPATTSQDLIPGFLSLFLVLLGYSLVAPLFVVALSRILGPLITRGAGVTGRLANRGIDAALSRTGIAITALAIAVSASIGVGTMVGSFRLAVERWLDRTLQADLYLASDDGGSTRTRGSFSDQDADQLRGLPGIAGISAGRPVKIDTPAGPVSLFALSLGPTGHRGLDFQAGNGETAIQDFQAGRGVIITEPFAFHKGLGVGDSLQLPTPQGPEHFPILAVVFDYGSDRGTVLMDRKRYARQWRDPTISTFGVYLDSTRDADRVTREVRAYFDARHSVQILPSGQIRERSLEIFDRTFTITGVLRLLVMAVAFVAIVGTLMALQLERAREYAILRATGFTPGQIWGTVTLQTTLMGIYAAMLALPLGLIISQILIDVINRRSFGWSMEMAVPWRVIADTLVLALVPSILGALYPAWRLARTPPARALREE